MQSWVNKFRYAIQGLRLGCAGQSSFSVHWPLSLAVIGIAFFLRCEIWQWCVLLLCIAGVISLEYINSALERLAKGVCHERNADVGAALDMAAAAVLVASLIAAVIGLLIFSQQLKLL